MQAKDYPLHVVLSERQQWVSLLIHEQPHGGPPSPLLPLLEEPSSTKSRDRVVEAIEMGIASILEVSDHEPMWAHHAHQFAGMCVQYSLNRLLKGLNDDVAITMMYSGREPVLVKDRSVALDRARLCLSSKTVRWASEREWRLFRSEQGPAPYSEAKTITRILLGSRVDPEAERIVRDAAKKLGVPVSKMMIEVYSVTFASPPRLVRTKRTG